MAGIITTLGATWRTHGQIIFPRAPPWRARGYPVPAMLFGGEARAAVNLPSSLRGPLRGSLLQCLSTTSQPGSTVPQIPGQGRHMAKRDAVTSASSFQTLSLSLSFPKYVLSSGFRTAFPRRDRARFDLKKTLKNLEHDLGKRQKSCSDSFEIYVILNLVSRQKHAHVVSLIASTGVCVFLERHRFTEEKASLLRYR